MRSYTKVSLAQIKQAVSELTREELESYAIINSLLLSVVGSLVLPVAIGMYFGSMLESIGYPEEESAIASDITKKVQDRVAQLTSEAN